MESPPERPEQDITPEQDRTNEPPQTSPGWPICQSRPRRPIRQRDPGQLGHSPRTKKDTQPRAGLRNAEQGRTVVNSYHGARRGRTRVSHKPERRPNGRWQRSRAGRSAGRCDPKTRCWRRVCCDNRCGGTLCVPRNEVAKIRWQGRVSSQNRPPGILTGRKARPCNFARCAPGRPARSKW